MPGPSGRLGGLASRRQLLARAAAGMGAGAGLGAAAGMGALAGLDAVALAGPASASGQTLPAASPDAQVLAHLLDVERKLIAAYHSVLASDVLNLFAAGRISELADQERQHLGALQVELGRLGTPQTLSLPAPVLAPATITEGLSLLLTAETAAESAYAAAVASLQAPRLIGLAAELMASEAQHWTVISILLQPGNLAGAVPSAFVDG